MRHQPIDIAFGGDGAAWPGEGREFAVVVRGSHVATHMGAVPFPPGNPVIHLDITMIGGFKIGAKGSIGAIAFLYQQQPDGTRGWTPIHRNPGGGQNTVIFDHEGQLRINDGTDLPEAGVNGFRYQDESGRFVTGDETYGSAQFGVGEFTRRGDLVVGQSGYNTAAVLLDAQGRPIERRILSVGAGPRGSSAIKVKRVGDDVAVTVHQFDLNRTQILWFHMNELHEFPEDRIVTDPIIVTPPPPPPPVEPEPPPMPDIQELTEMVRSTVTAVNALHPDLLQRNTKESCGEFTERVVNVLSHKDAKFGHVGKQPGQTNYRLHAVDAVMYKSPKQVWDIIGGAENHPHPGQPAANPVEHGDQPWMAPIPVAGEPTPPPPPPPPPASDVQAQIDALRHIVIAQEGTLVGLERRLKVLEDAPELPLPPVPQLPGKLRARGKTSAAGGGWWGKSHQHDIDVEVVPE